jgi:hypothetical protein
MVTGRIWMSQYHIYRFDRAVLDEYLHGPWYRQEGPTLNGIGA